MSITTPSLRTWLFVPGTSPARFDKARDAHPSAVIIDLEDAVPDAHKDEARLACLEWLGQPGNHAFVRINATGTKWYDDDIEAIVALAGLRGILLPKARLSAVAALSPRSTVIVPLIEDAVGLDEAFEIASTHHVLALAFGSLDFALDIGCAHTRESLL